MSHYHQDLVSVLWTAAQITSLDDLQLAYSADVFSTAAAQPYWGGAAGNPYQYFAYPPHFLLFLWPIGQVPYVFAFFIYALINPLILAAVVWAAFQRSWVAAGFVVLAPAAVLLSLGRADGHAGLRPADRRDGFPRTASDSCRNPSQSAFRSLFRNGSDPQSA